MSPQSHDERVTRDEQPRHHLSRRAFLYAVPAGLGTFWLRANQQERMNTRPIPGTAEALPVIGLGTWQTFDVTSASELRSLADVLQQFVAAGARVIDSSPMYGRAESVVGELAERLRLKSRLFYATKVWTAGRERGVQQMHESFQRMRVQRMDLMQVHNLLDADIHLRTLAAWKQEGRVRYVGITHYQVSAYDALERLIRRGGIDFVQFNYSLATRAAEQRMLPAAAEHGVAVLINRPYESGEMFQRVRGRPLPDWAADIDCQSWGQVFLKYIISHPAVTCVIPATSNPRHLEDNVRAGLGRLPDAALRRRMAQTWDAL
jgi:diketogulonate reductase-like aldo/keto reductase